jgi:alkanesulfonate monooxygenase SsuD/methylene tetrahydromethanopterin reductase-like flavin-dependent oxidoreductase (luciferase family)
MRFGLNMPNFGEFADPATVVDLARDAEKAGWEGFFLWDHINPFGEWEVPLADPWVLLAAVAQATTRMRLGTLVTPVPRRRPWVLARQTATLDHLSNGRLTLGVGLGVPAASEFGAFGEETDIKIRAEKLDEGLAILAGLWTGEPFEFQGRHFDVERTRFQPAPVQRPRIPVWVAAVWGKEGPLRRAARFEGVFPLKMDPDGGEGEPIEPEEYAELRRRLEKMRDGRPIEIVMTEEVTDNEPRDPARLRSFADAGVTWYMEGLGTRHVTLEDLVARVRKGPPRL